MRIDRGWVMIPLVGILTTAFLFFCPPEHKVGLMGFSLVLIGGVGVWINKQRR